MIERTYETERGRIHYWVSDRCKARPTLVLLPGLTADHRLFDRQVEAFEGRYNLLVWDAPGHGKSRPFDLTFSLEEKAAYLHAILKREGMERPVLIGQSMGGYVAQSFLQAYPGEASGFISIDSAPLKRKYITAAELWLLKRMEPVYRLYPFRALLRDGIRGNAVTPYGRALMEAIWSDYDKDGFCRLSAHGFCILAQAIERCLPYEIPCPCLLLCGEKDMAGSTKRYNRAWAKTENLPLVYIDRAGHNANTDNPQQVNDLIDGFVRQIRSNTILK